MYSHIFSDFFLLSLNNESDFNMPTLDEIFFLRKNYSMYRWFCNNILPEVIGFTEFKKLANYEHLSKFITVSDEAFVLLCFKNYYFPVHYEALKKMKDEDEIVDEIKKKNVPLYTRSGAYGNSQGMNSCFKYSGWTVEGMTEYNNLMDIVKTDRLENNAFDKNLLNYNLQQQ